MPLNVTAESSVPPEFLDRHDCLLLKNFDFYVPFSSARTELFWAVVRQARDVVATVPVVKLKRRMSTAMLRQPWKRALGLLFGPLSLKTTLLVDTSFLAYDDSSPFWIADGIDRDEVKRTVSDFLKAQRRIDSVWISEPVHESQWASLEGYDQLLTLPMVHVDLESCKSFEDYLTGLSKKKRRNARHEQGVFAAAGGTIECHEPALDELAVGQSIEELAKLSDELLSCLDASAAHSQFNVPYNDVLINPDAFCKQKQTILFARAGGDVVGFMSFLQDGDRLMQCHGGLDYERSHSVLAYHNLIQAGIRMAIDRGCRTLSMGPLNNETKRRAGTSFKPIVGSLWNRLPTDRWIARKLFIRNFEVYRGAVAELDATAGAPE